MAGRPSFANVNTNDTDGMMLTSYTVVYVKTANVKVRVCVFPRTSDDG